MIRSLTSCAMALTPVQQTSLLVAYWRMLETSRSSMKNAPSPSLVQDELATVLVDKLASKELVESYKSSPFLPIGINCLAIRTRIIDDWLLASTSDDGDCTSSSPRQVVNLGAGMCTRPYRLDYHVSTVVFEVDDPDVLMAKRQVLRDAGYEPRVKVVDVAGDVTEMDHLQESLMKQGFDPSIPTDWIGEGLLEYLEPENHATLFRGAKKYGGVKGSRFMCQVCDPFCQEYVVNMMGVNIPWSNLRPVPDILEELSDAGWSRGVTVLGDEEFMRMFQRIVSIPIYLVMAEADDDESKTDKTSQSSSTTTFGTSGASALTPVQQTSLLMAYWRMLETSRSRMKDAPTPSLCQDDLAAILVHKLASKELLEQYRSSPFLSIGLNCLAIRTRVIDDWLTSRGASPRQIVNLGAGMCTRPYRLDLGVSTVVFEVDDLNILKAKRQVLKESGHEPCVTVVDVAGDVTKMDQLVESLMKKGFDPSIPTDWIGEGLFAYIDPATHMSVFQGAKQCGGVKGSRFIFSACDPFCQDYVADMMGVDLPWAGLRPIPEIVQELVESGWSKDVTILGDEDFMRMFKRAVTLPILLVTAEVDDVSVTSENIPR